MKYTQESFFGSEEFHLLYLKSSEPKELCHRRVINVDIQYHKEQKSSQNTLILA